MPATGSCYFGEGIATVNSGATVTVRLTIYRSDEGNAIIDGRIVDSLPNAAMLRT